MIQIQQHHSHSSGMEHKGDRRMDNRRHHLPDGLQHRLRQGGQSIKYNAGGSQGEQPRG